MANIIETEFLINTPFSSFQARVVTPKWSKGFECTPQTCGLCCISELPNNMPTKDFKPFNCRICCKYNTENKMCKAYDKRPWGCKTYPFLFGFENGTLIISPSLECPATNEEEMNFEAIKESFSESQVAKSLEEQELIFYKVKGSKIWKNADKFWLKLSNEISDVLNLSPNFPVMENAKSLILEVHNNYYNIKSPMPKHPHMNVILSDMLKNKGGIATNFDSNNPYYVRVKKGRARIISLELNSNKIEETYVGFPDKPLELEMDIGALKILKDYVKLLMKRPFLALSTISLGIAPRYISTFAISNLMGAFVNLEAGATFYACKNEVNKLDSNAIREIISFADGCLMSQFRNPEGAIH
ncbi:MAG: hypothetical protein CW691_02460 [Candidatus Bathyarchaeum sp.]|nr:MAG: hypothetical protein CW691_02460 [Candidatus Bathyarchaeum sp.]